MWKVGWPFSKKGDLEVSWWIGPWHGPIRKVNVTKEYQNNTKPLAIQSHCFVCCELDSQVNQTKKTILQEPTPPPCVFFNQCPAPKFSPFDSFDVAAWLNLRKKKKELENSEEKVSKLEKASASGRWVSGKKRKDPTRAPMLTLGHGGYILVKVPRRKKNTSFLEPQMVV